MNKTTTILILLCVLTTAGALWWVSQMSHEDEGSTLTEWTKETDKTPTSSTPSAAPAPDGQAEPTPTQNPRDTKMPQRGERIEFEDPAERTAEGQPTVAEINQLIESGEAANHLLALDLLRDMDAETAWPLMNKLLKSESVQVRSEAVELAVEFDDDNTGPFLTQAVTDESAYVGYTVLEAADDLPRDEREKIRRAAVRAAPVEVGTSVLADVEVESNHKSVDVLIEGLNSQMEETRFESREILSFLFDQEFDSATAANDWWQANRDKYDRDLVEKE
jgi:HEAT repeat protein